VYGVIADNCVIVIGDLGPVAVIPPGSLTTVYEVYGPAD